MDIKEFKVYEIKYLEGEEPQEFLLELFIFLKKYLESFTFEFASKQGHLKAKDDKPPT